MFNWLWKLFRRSPAKRQSKQVGQVLGVHQTDQGFVVTARITDPDVRRLLIKREHISIGYSVGDRVTIDEPVRRLERDVFDDVDE